MKLEDLAVVKTLLQNGFCRNASVSFVRDKKDALHGFVEHSNNHCSMLFISGVTGQRVVMLCNREGNRRSGVALAMWHKL